MSFEDDLNATVDPYWTDVDALVNGNLYTFRFTVMDGVQWANECDKCPARPGVRLDALYGYDLRALTMNVAPLCGARVTPEGTEPLNPDQWKTLLEKLDGQAFRLVSDAIWGLNEYLPAEAVKAAKKALLVSARQSQPRSTSASPRKGSSAGSRRRSPSTSTTTKGE